MVCLHLDLNASDFLLFFNAFSHLINSLFSLMVNFDRSIFSIFLRAGDGFGAGGARLLILPLNFGVTPLLWRPGFWNLLPGEIVLPLTLNVKFLILVNFLGTNGFFLFAGPLVGSCLGNKPLSSGCLGNLLQSTDLNPFSGVFFSDTANSWAI